MSSSSTDQTQSGDGGVRDRTTATVLGLALGPAVVLGLARFAYALLLPSMQTELSWSLSTAGAMNSANAIGYLVGALSSAPLARRFGTRRSFLIALNITVLSLLLTATSADTTILLLLRALAGVTGAIAFITGAGLVARLAAGQIAHKPALLLGIYFAGGGAGIVISGLSIPVLLAHLPAATGWRWGWILLGLIGIVASVLTWLATRQASEPPPQPHHDRHWPARRFVPMLSSYGLFGVGYIAYMTFIVAFLHNGGAGATEITLFWGLLGATSIIGAFFWVRPISALARARGLAVILATLAVGAILPLISHSLPIAMASALLFGGSFLAVVTAVTSVARRSLPEHHWTPAIATLTVVFAVGQIIGPVLTGAISEGPSGLTMGLGISAGLLIIAGLVALAQRPVDDAQPFHDTVARIEP
ncbi:YbfB/YjiJ family MFS transporter [Ferrimicrobium sp.]|uniref:YbfB/YjiJ family MFS transporter n=1 Tax=Ferrimicrobium sp. TaxID=2926050 RepID=UPI00261AF04E|nr:YbfB/YjiJ family MFS transporter [Ferrimicrobium sp.]